MYSFLILLLPTLVVHSTFAFVSVTPLAVAVHQQQQKRTSLVILSASKQQKKSDLTINPYEGYQGVNIQRARECVNNVGECTLREMEMLKQGNDQKIDTCILLFHLHILKFSHTFFFQLISMIFFF